MRLGAQRPRLARVPEGIVTSAGDEAITLIESCWLSGRRVVLDEWQKWCIHNALGEDAQLRLIAWSVLIIVPRQNGKNLILAAIELFHLYLAGSRRIVHSAHRADTALDHYELMKELIESNPSYAAITKFYGSNGKERIVRTDTGARIRFMTRSKSPLRGGSPQLIVLDEALVLTRASIAAMFPSLSAQSMNEEGAPQIIYASSAPLEDSEVLHDVRNQAFFPTTVSEYDRMFAAEWGIELPEGGFNELDITDRDLWAQANPGLNVRISEEWIQTQELEGPMTEQEFAEERLGVVFPRNASTGDAKIPPEPWASTATSNPPAIEPGDVTIAWGISTDGMWSAIAIGTGIFDHPYVELIRHNPETSALQEEGVGWLPAELVRLTKKWKPKKIGCRSTGPAAAQLASVMAAFRAADLSTDIIHPYGTGEFAAACGWALTAIVEGRLQRPTGQEVLDAAVAAAGARKTGDGFVWAPITADVPICSLDAITIAGHLLPTEIQELDPIVMVVGGTKR